MACGCMSEPPTPCTRRKRPSSPAWRNRYVIPGRVEDANLRCAIAHRGISRFRVRRFASPRNDGATLGLNAAEPQSAVIGPPFDFRWVSVMPRNVAYRGKSGNHELLSSIAGFDRCCRKSLLGVTNEIF